MLLTPNVKHVLSRTNGLRGERVSMRFMINFMVDVEQKVQNTSYAGPREPPRMTHRAKSEGGYRCCVNRRLRELLKDLFLKISAMFYCI